jgi:ABC-type multidrug transport system fused ATPase/permease subunit
MNCGINRWLMFWTTGAVGTASIGAAAFLAAATGRASPGLAAMAIKYSMQVSWALIWLVRAFTDTETQCVSVERIIEYSKLDPEEDQSPKALADRATPGPAWPEQGRVTWRNVSLRYRPNLDPALRCAANKRLFLMLETINCVLKTLALPRQARDRDRER